MFYALDKYNQRVHIDETIPTEAYFCPICKEQLILRRGNIISHHFSHKSNTHCDPWYIGKMSIWHRLMQELFPPSTREVVVPSKNHTEYHIADVLLTTEDNRYVFEFQHSPINDKAFVERSLFYLKQGYSLIWIFDYIDCESPKQLYYSQEYAQNRIKRVLWPGRDRVKLFDSPLFRELWYKCHQQNINFRILFHISSGCAEPFDYSYMNNQISIQYTNWRYINPLSNQEYFIEPDFASIDKINDFYAEFYTKDDFIEYIENLM